MTDIHAVIAGLKALEAQSRIIGGHWAKLYTDDAIATLPQLLAYIERLEAVASAARNRLDTWTRETYIELNDALDALERDE